jgi:hypothetical protein
MIIAISTARLRKGRKRLKRDHTLISTSSANPDDLDQHYECACGKWRRTVRFDPGGYLVNQLRQVAADHNEHLAQYGMPRKNYPDGDIQGRSARILNKDELPRPENMAQIWRFR